MTKIVQIDYRLECTATGRRSTMLTYCRPTNRRDGANGWRKQNKTLNWNMESRGGVERLRMSRRHKTWSRRLVQAEQCRFLSSATSRRWRTVWRSGSSGCRSGQQGGTDEPRRVVGGVGNSGAKKMKEKGEGRWSAAEGCSGMQHEQKQYAAAL